MSRLGTRPERAFVRSLTRASTGLGSAWWCLVIARAVLPSVLAIVTGR